MVKKYYLYKIIQLVESIFFQFKISSEMYLFSFER